MSQLDTPCVGEEVVSNCVQAVVGVARSMQCTLYSTILYNIHIYSYTKVYVGRLIITFVTGLGF